MPKNVWVSQGTVTTSFRCSGQVGMYPVQNLVLFTPVKELWKSVTIWQSYSCSFHVHFLRQNAETTIHWFATDTTAASISTTSTFTWWQNTTTLNNNIDDDDDDDDNNNNNNNKTFNQVQCSLLVVLELRETKFWSLLEITSWLTLWHEGNDWQRCDSLGT